MISGADEVRDIRGERRVGEIAFAGAQPREVEAENGDAVRRQRHRNAPRRVGILAAGEAMRKQRGGAWRAIRQVERRRQPVAAGAFELETFGGHNVVPNRLRLLPLEAMTQHRLTLSYNRYGYTQI